MMMRYEDLLSDPEAMITRLSEEFSLHRRQPHFVNYLNSTKDGSKGYDFYRKYYLEEIWREELTPHSIEIINDRLARNIIHYFNYELIG